jgi:mRNA interferase RelE/StbE
VAVYRVLIKASAAKEIEALPSKQDRQRIVSQIYALAENPRPIGSEKLAGKDHWCRVRQGRYRIVYDIQDRDLLVFIVKVGHRKEVYR